MATANAKDKEPQKINLIGDIITSPYDKVLMILNEAKRFIGFISKTQNKLIRDLDWAIRVITSHSLYTYDISTNEKIEKISKENPDLQQLFQFVNNYNEEVIEVNKKNTLLQRAQVSIDETGLHTPSLQLKKKLYNISGFKRKKINSNNLIIQTSANKQDQQSSQQLKPTFTIDSPSHKVSINSLNKSTKIRLLLDPKEERNLLTHHDFSPKISQNLSNSMQRKSGFHSPIQNESKINGFHWMKMENMLNKYNFDLKTVLSKDFDLFELKKIVGHDNVLPLVGKTLFEAFGINDTMINTQKLDSFLIAISNNYLPNVPYHNSLHGADVTQTVAVFLMNSNIEEIAETNVVDILSLFIACLGHDLGHPGLTNNYQINSFSEIALTYNDMSCLENYHAFRLFKISRTKENNILEKMPLFDYSTLRKRIISMVLATDMSNHKKVLSLIKSNIPSLHDSNGNAQFEFIPKGSKNVFELQQSLLDFMIHASDLAHNTKQFNISLHWVELLSNEFWNQGDKEKSMQLPVSFLCERVDHDIPKSQVGFIKGFIFPTFEVLVEMFPTLNYLMEYSKDNLSHWEKLVEENRKKGWSPKEKKEKQVINKPLNATWGKPKLLIVKGKKPSNLI